MQLIDQYGRPIEKRKLLEEQAAPSMTGVRQILSGYATRNLNPGKLAGILRAADEGDAESYLEMAEELEEKDPHYLSVLGTRKRAVSQLEITVEPASDDKNDVANADLIENWLKRDQLEAEIVDILDAIGKGYSATEIIWELSESQWMPKDLIWRDPRWFEFNRNDGTTLLLREGSGAVPLTPYKFIYHRHKAKSGIPIRGGVVRPCAWMWLFKNFSIKDWVIFAEAYGQPVRIGKYGPGASEEDRNVLLRAVANIGSDAAAIIPESMKIEFIEAEGKTGTADVFERLGKFCDQQISKAVLGQTTTVDAISGGHAVSQEHNDVRGDIERSDAKQLAATLNEFLTRPIVDLNRGPQKAYPRIRIGRSEDVDIDKLSLAAERAVKMGARVSKSRLVQVLGLPEAEDDDDVLTPPQGTAGATGAPEAASVAKATASQDAEPAGDAISDFADEMAEDWEEVMNPVVAELEDAINTSATFEELSQKLLKLASRLKFDPAVEKLAQAAFSARLAGNHEIEMEK